MFTLNFYIAIMVVILIAGIAFLIARKIISSDVFVAEVNDKICDSDCNKQCSEPSLTNICINNGWIDKPENYALLGEQEIKIIDINLTEGIAKYTIAGDDQVYTELISNINWINSDELKPYENEEAGSNIIME